MAKKEKTTEVKLYYCDRKYCKVCSNPKENQDKRCCNYTTDPAHEGNAPGQKN